MNVGAFVFGAYMLRIETSSWHISPVMSKKCPSLSFLITFGWKFTLFDIRIATPACFLGPFAWKFFFPTFYSEIVSVFVSDMSFLYEAKCWILFMYPVWQPMFLYWGVESIYVNRYQGTVVSVSCYYCFFGLSCVCVFFFFWFSCLGVFLFLLGCIFPHCIGFST